jgi:hypothetical protein
MVTIHIHKSEGKNHHKRLCPRCGVATGEIAQFKAKEPVTTCPHCGTVNYAAGTSAACGRCSKPMTGGRTRPIRKKEPVPSHVACPKCAEEIRGEQTIVTNGGLFFRCKECGKTGIVLPESGVKIRADIGKGYEKPDEHGKYLACGIEFKACKQHDGTGEAAKES